MTEKEFKGIPFLDEIRVKNQPLPLWHAHWRGLHRTALDIRQEVSLPKDQQGLGFTLTQYENTRIGVESIQGAKLSKEFLRHKRSGVEEWANKLCCIINRKIKGFRPIERLERVILREQKTYSLAYYGSFYSNQMEIIIRIGFRENTDGARVTYRARSKLDLETRDIELLSQWLPQTIWIKEASS